MPGLPALVPYRHQNQMLRVAPIRTMLGGANLGLWRRVVFPVVAGLLGLAFFPLIAHSASVIVSGNSSVNMTTDDGPRNVSLGFFDDASGERIARLQIGLMTLSFRHQGVFRVAWKPQVILTEVTLQLTNLAACRTVGAQLPEALRSIGAGGSLQLRAIVLEIQQPAVLRIEASGAEFTTEGDLRLLRANRSDEPTEAARTMLLRLNGPAAGSLENMPGAPLPILNPSQPVTLSNP